MQLNPVERTADVGVIVGRFQVHDLHDGHHDLIQSVVERHQKVVIYLGSTPGVLVTRNNPLDFQTRRVMVNTHYPDVNVLPMPDMPRDVDWSDELDRRISEVIDPASALLYGSRDGFASAYTGKFPVVELAARRHVTGTSIRKQVSHAVRASAEFRRGVIYAAFNRHPTMYQTVDAAVIKNRGAEDAALLLGRKKTDAPGCWRFFGGFGQPHHDETLEFAASRELHEEAPGIAVHLDPIYLGSRRIHDWRYRNESDGIMTSLFLFDFFSGSTRAGDDIDEVHWFPLDTLTASVFVDAHVPLFELLTAHLQGSK